MLENVTTDGYLTVQQGLNIAQEDAVIHNLKLGTIAIQLIEKHGLLEEYKKEVSVLAETHQSPKRIQNVISRPEI